MPSQAHAAADTLHALPSPHRNRPTHLPALHPTHTQPATASDRQPPHSLTPHRTDPTHPHPAPQQTDSRPTPSLRTAPTHSLTRHRNCPTPASSPARARTPPS
ncbi:hypothetical protein GCM10009741_79290 [Kribbella lupini]|uniref:Uncharacterized protein n=1 Tax=Kribbella lupini TaxID=291602 RepID=A0ABP4NHZ3_9ACTN